MKYPSTNIFGNIRSNKGKIGKLPDKKCSLTAGSFNRFIPQARYRETDPLIVVDTDYFPEAKD